jgi:hypothetical protein
MSDGQLNLPVVLVQTRDQRRASDDSSVEQALDQRRVTRLLIEAVDATCSEKEAAIALGMDPTYWSKVKKGERPGPRLEKLDNLPERTQQDFAARYGRMLKMTVSTDDERRRMMLDALEAMTRAIKVMA